MRSRYSLIYICLANLKTLEANAAIDGLDIALKDIRANLERSLRLAATNHRFSDSRFLKSGSLLSELIYKMLKPNSTTKLTSTAIYLMQLLLQTCTSRQSIGFTLPSEERVTSSAMRPVSLV